MRLTLSTFTTRLVLGGLLIFAAACGTTPTPPPTPVTVQLSYTHQAQFAGFYAADQNGDYAREGLVVTFVEGGSGINQLDALASGKAQFSVQPAEQVILARSEGRPAVAIAAIFRRSPRVYVAMANSGITRPEDFVGKTIAVSQGSRPQLAAILRQVGVGEGQYTLVEPSSDLAQLISGEVDVRAVWLTNEVLKLKSAGNDLAIIYPDDYGIHNYADTIATSQDLLSTNPDLLLRFLRATLQGWSYAVEHPDDTGALVLMYNSRADPVFEVAQMTASLPLINTGEDFIGWMKPAIWEGMERTLREQGVLSAPVDVTQAYTLRFLEEIYAP